MTNEFDDDDDLDDDWRDCYNRGYEQGKRDLLKQLIAESYDNNGLIISQERLFELYKKRIEQIKGGKKMFEIPSSKERVTHCPDCNNRIVDEFPELDYVNCSGCPRIFNRIKEVKPNSSYVK